MPDCDGPQCDPEAEKPLLPKWLAWTWPTHWGWWILWGIGFFVAGYGAFLLLTDMATSFLTIGLGLFLIGYCHPNPFGQMMKNQFSFGTDKEGWSTPPLPPMDPDDWHLDRKLWNEDVGAWLPNPLARFSQDVPNVYVEEDGGEWVAFFEGNEPKRFTTPKEAAEYMEKEIKNGEKIDAQELLFGEHPRHNRYRALYNATPPQFTSRFIFHTFSVFFIIGFYLAIPHSARENTPVLSYLPIGLMVLGALAAIGSHYAYRSSVEAWDTITSIIKYVDGGHGELVGQIRPISSLEQGVLHVDGCKAASWTFDDLVAWSWAYTCTETWTERYYDEQSKSWKTRTRSETRTIRSASHTSDFMIHDGTGGMAVKLPTFDRINMGGPIWSRERRPQQGGDKLAESRHGGSLKHAWTLSALRLGDPIYMMARIKSRPQDDIPRGTVGFNATRVHQTLEAVGEDAPRRRAKITKGNEFSVLSAKNSITSRLGPLMLLIMGALVMMVL
ncbi:MAG: hypothetical protein QF440_03210 [Candidatus Thalassarchaeaceae archaeon]|nr:hypothetical protein [Candidatus Thalassarchaeaceae archaeon]